MEKLPVYTKPTDYNVPVVSGMSDYSLRMVTLNPQRYTERTVSAARREQEIRRQIIDGQPAIQVAATV
jgi:hypothetical protein